jgi:hypothetical protein
MRASRQPAGITDDRAKLNAQTPNSVLSHTLDGRNPQMAQTRWQWLRFVGKGQQLTNPTAHGAPPAGVRCQISRPVDSERGPFAGFAIEVGPARGPRRSRSDDWPAATARWGIPCREARRADFTGMKGRSTMVVNLIMRSCRPRSFANQTGPCRSETSGRAAMPCRRACSR